MKKRADRGRRGTSGAKSAALQASATAESQLVQIEKPVYGGAFLARLEGKAVFVPLTLPGEQARVRVVEEKRGYATAEAEAILRAAPERVQPKCPYFGVCGGCQYQHADDAAQLGYKQAILRETLERGGVHARAEIDVLAADPWTYRNRIRLAFDAEGNPGYRGRRSHAVVPIAECPIAAPLLVKTALSAAELFRRLPPQDRPAEISVFCGADEQSVLATVFTARNEGKALHEVVASMPRDLPAVIGAELVRQRADEPPRTIARAGADALFYRAAGFYYRVDRSAFFQVNRWLVDALVERVTAGRRGRLAWDLFAGVGLFARQLAARYDHVVAVESAPAATGALSANLQGVAGTAVQAPTVDFLRKSLRSEQPDRIVPDLIVVDPPRTGLGAETTALLAERSAPAVTYVSCDPATLARDLKALLASGYSIERLTLADLFPQTFHVETIVDLRRS